MRSQCSEVELIDLTGDDNAQMKQKLLNLEQKVLDRSDALKESLAKLILNEDERKVYEYEVLEERTKLDKELLLVNRRNDELKRENVNLKNLQSDCQQQMKLLMEVDKKRNEDKNSFELFGSLPQKEVHFQNGDKAGTYKVHVVEDEIKEAEQIDVGNRQLDK